MAIKRVLAFLLCLLLAVPCLALETAAVKESAVFQLTADELRALCDPDETQDILFLEDGFMLEDGAAEGIYTTLPISMPEFTMISLSAFFENTCEADMPELSMSVYRKATSEWSPFILLPDGENAKRTKESDPTVAVRFRVTLRRAAADSPVFRTLVVTGGEHFFTRENIIMVFIMLSAGVVLILKKKKRIGVWAKKGE